MVGGSPRLLLPVRNDGFRSKRRSSEQKLIFRMILPPSKEIKKRQKKRLGKTKKRRDKKTKRRRDKLPRVNTCVL